MRGDCRSNERTNSHDRIGQITESCSQMVLQFHDHIDVSKIYYFSVPISNIIKNSRFKLLNFDSQIFLLLLSFYQ